MQSGARWWSLLSLLAWVALATPVSAAQQQAPIAGRDYQLVKPPQPTESGDKIEVIEFFWYGCPGCAQVQAPMRAWLNRKPADVAVKHQPAAFQQSWLQLARTYYTIESLSLTDKLHADLFKAIHEQRTLDPAKLVRDPEPLFNWVASRGVDRKRFVDAYNSFSVQSRTQRTIDITRRYDVPATPTFVVDGRYLTSPSMTGGYERLFQVVDQLIAEARKTRGAK
jgi:protein dithiol oxidoreductase (disulfide-forming)